MLELIGEGMSLRAACREYGIHSGQMHAHLHSEDGLRAQYERAREMRAEVQAEEALDVSRAAALSGMIDGRKVDAAGARVLLDAIKWSTARMAPKTAPVQRIDVTSRTRTLTNAEIAAEIAALEGGGGE